MEKLVVSEECIGCGICFNTNDKYFKMGDDGFSRVAKEKIDEDDKKEILNIIESCPAEAIKIEEDSNNNENK